MMKPKDRTAMIQAQIEEEMAKRKDHRWEDVSDVSLVIYSLMTFA
jgi:hypothetical protein